MDWIDWNRVVVFKGGNNHSSEMATPIFLIFHDHGAVHACGTPHHTWPVQLRNCHPELLDPSSARTGRIVRTNAAAMQNLVAAL